MFLGTIQKKYAVKREKYVGGLVGTTLVEMIETLVLHQYQCENCNTCVSVVGKAEDRFYCRECQYEIGI